MQQDHAVVLGRANEMSDSSLVQGRWIGPEIDHYETVHMACENCRWWEGWERDGEQTGKCRRHAPRPYSTADRMTAGSLDAGWPVTDATDFCGEHILK